jgi:hypothetical protein
LPFDATLASCPSARRSERPWPSSTLLGPGLPSTSLELPHPSAFPDEAALLLAPSSPKKRLAWCPPNRGVPPPGFGYPLDGVRSPHPAGASFSSQRSWASPSKAFLLHDDQSSVSQEPLRPRAFPEDSFRLPSAPQRLAPIVKAVPLFAPEGLARVGALALLGLFDLLGAPSSHDRGMLSLHPSPLSLLASPGLTTRLSLNPRVSLGEGLALSPRRGRRPIWPSSPTAPETS